MGVSLFNGLFPFHRVLVPMCSPAFLLQKLFPGRCPENGSSFEYVGEARAFLRGCCHLYSFAERLCAARKEGHFGNEVSPGVFEC